MNKPLISIVLPTYNGEKYLSQAIQSVINQTYINWELIIVDDCSKDNTLKIANKFASNDNRIKVLSNNINLKLPASLNRGFRKAKGEYYTWTSDDNIYYPEALEKMVEFLDKNLDYGMVYAQINVEKNGIMQNYVWCNEETTPERLLEISVPGACFLYRASIAQIVGEYDETMFLNEDHDYWLRIFLQTKIGNINEVLYLYRLRKGSLTKTKEFEIKKGKMKLLRKYRKIYLKKFPQIKEILKADFMFDEFLKGKLNFKDLRKNLPSQKVYKMLKYEYLFNNNKKYLNFIFKLGFIYIFKATILYLKTRGK